MMNILVSDELCNRSVVVIFVPLVPDRWRTFKEAEGGRGREEASDLRCLFPRPPSWE